MRDTEHRVAEERSTGQSRQFTGVRNTSHNAFPQYRQKELEAIYRWSVSNHTVRDDERLEYDLRLAECECDS